MNKFHRVFFCFFLIPLFSYSSEKYDHVTTVVEFAKKCFGHKMRYELLQEVLEEDNKIRTESKVINHYATSKTGNTLLVYSEFFDKSPFGLFDIITLQSFESLKEFEDFNTYAFAVITSIKIGTKKYNLEVPKPLVQMILENGFTRTYFDYDNHNIKRMKVGFLNTMRYHFPHYKSSTVFADDNHNIAVNFKDENNNNILYTLDQHNTSHLIVPVYVNEDNHKIIHKDLCNPGTIQKVTIKHGTKIDNPSMDIISNFILERPTSTLKVKKDNKKYVVDLPL